MIQGAGESEREEEEEEEEEERDDDEEELKKERARHRPPCTWKGRDTGRRVHGKGGLHRGRIIPIKPIDSHTYSNTHMEYLRSKSIERVQMRSLPNVAPAGVFGTH